MPNSQESFEERCPSWATVVLSTLLMAMQNATDIPKGYQIDGISINEGNKKGLVNVTFVFKEVK